MTIGRMYRLLWEQYSKILRLFYCKDFKMKLGEGVAISPRAHLDKGAGYRLYVGKNTEILANATILCHDHCRRLSLDTVIGDNCVIGINSIIMPGLTIGNEVVVGGGTIVTKDIPSNCMVVGNPGKIIRKDIKVKNGIILDNGERVK